MNRLYKKYISIVCYALIIAIVFAGCIDAKEKKDARIIWQYGVSDSYFYYTTPVLSKDEQIIYIATATKEADPQSSNDRLIALNRDGALLWEYKTQNAEIKSNLVIYNDIILFVGDYNRTISDHQSNAPMSKEKSILYAVKDDGTLAWSKDISSSGNTSGPKYEIIVYNEKILVVSEKINVLNCEDGTVIFESERLYPEGDYLTYIRAYLNGSNAYFVYQSDIYIFNMQSFALDTVDLKMFYPNPPRMVIKGAISFDSQNNIYLGYHHAYLSLDSQYNFRWIYDSEDGDISFRSTPIIDEATGRLYVGTKANEKSEFIALNLDDGTLAWSYFTGQDVYSSPALCGGKLYFGSEAKKLHVLTTEGQLVYEIAVHQDLGWPSPVIDSQGILYVGGNRGFLFAINTN